MDSRISSTSFPLLDLPGELRDLVYEHALFASAWTTDTSQRRENLKNGVQIHTNILLTSRQVFEEARNVMIDAQLVKVSIRGGKPQSLRSAAAIEDGIPMFHTRYTKFCLLKHRITDHSAPAPWDESGYTNCVIRKEDVFRFCGGISGLNPNRYVPQMLCDRISHSLVPVNPGARLPPGPDRVSIRVPTHNRLLKEYQKVLAGCQDIWVSEHWSLEREMGVFTDDMVEKIMSSSPSRICSLNGRLVQGEDDVDQDFQGLFIE